VTEELDMLKTTARAILSVKDGPFSEKIDFWPSPAWAALDGAGLTSVGFDEKRGGSGGSLVDIATLVFEVGRSYAKVPLPETIMFSSWLRGLADWEWSGGAETVGFANDAHLQTRTAGERLLLDGSVGVVPWARATERMTIVTTVNGRTVLVSLKLSDVRIEPSENLAGEPRDTVIIESLRVEDDDYYELPMDVENIELRGAFMRAVASTGALCAMFELTLNFARQREQFGRPIAKFQAVQQLLARLGEEVSAATTSVGAAVAALETGEGGIASMCAVVRVMQAATHSARIAHQIHGAIGTTAEYPLHHFTQRLWCWKSEYGSEARWSRAISHHVRNRNDDAPLWSIVTAGE
jgi:acyl-CoA dehydrogenase